MKKLSLLLILLVVCCMSLPASAASSSRNPSFEVPDPCDANRPEHWFFWGSFETPEDRIIYRQNDANAYDGTDFIETNMDGQWAGFAQSLYTNHYHAHYTAKGGYTNIPNDVNVGEVYTLNSYAMDPNGTGRKFSYKFEYYYGPNDVFESKQYEVLSDNLDLTGTWKNYQFSDPGGVPNDCNRVNITWVQYGPDHGLGEAWFDLSNLLSGGQIGPCGKTKQKERADPNDGYFDPIPGDFNEDCYVDMFDIDELLENYLDCSLDPDSNCPLGTIF